MNDYVFLKDHIPRNTPNNRRPGTSLAATTITIHNTANPSSTDKNERGWLTNSQNTRTASYHYAIDERHVIEVIPPSEVAYHAGDAFGNRSSIGIEICESGNYAKTLENAAKFVAKMLHDRGWGIDRLRRHFDWSGKHCPRLMRGNGDWGGWQVFKNKVQAELDDLRRYKMTKEDADKVIALLGASWHIAIDKASKNEFNRLANELRKASNQPTQ